MRHKRKSTPALSPEFIRALATVVNAANATGALAPHAAGACNLLSAIDEFELLFDCELRASFRAYQRELKKLKQGNQPDRETKMKATPTKQTNVQQQDRDVCLPAVTYAEGATILAALRVFQRIIGDPNSPIQRIPQNAGELYVMEHFEEVGESSLPTVESIDELCERINLMPSSSVRDRAADFFNALRGPCDYDYAILAFEKLVAEYAPAATGKDILEIMSRAYCSAGARGTLDAFTNRDSELWKEGER